MMPIQVELPASPSQSVCKRLMIGRDYAGKRGLSREYSQNRPAIEKVKKITEKAGMESEYVSGDRGNSSPATDIK
jgi:hypothetical protein